MPPKRFNGDLSGEKQDVLEGGIRVPGIVAWPGRFPDGQVISTPVHGCDWMPTLFALTGAADPLKVFRGYWNDGEDDQ